MNRQVLKEPISVEYIDHMGSDVRVSNVAKTSFAKWEDESVAINEKQKGLLKYLATGLPSSERSDWEARAKASPHWSPYGHCFLSVRCAAPIFLTRQLLKHQVGLCLAEDTEVTFVKQANGVSNGVYTKSLKQIADHWFGKVKFQGGAKGKLNVTNSHVRVYNEQTQRFEISKITNVIDSGVKPVLKIVDEFGNELKATADHTVLTPNGWVAAGELVAGDLLIRSDNGETYGYSESARGGSNDVIARREFRATLDDFVDCQGCGEQFAKDEVQVDHVIAVSDGGLHEKDNLQPLCSACHNSKSKGERKGKTTLLPKYVKIVGIEPAGMQQCYDISVDNIHNFLGNGFVVHNCWNEESRRYITDDVAIWVPETVHKAPEFAKQGASKEAHASLMYAYNHGDGDVHMCADEFIQWQAEQGVQAYYQLLNAGVAPEEARIVLPQNAVTHWVWSGSLMAMLRIVKQRVDSHAQNAAQDFGLKLLTIVEDKFPHSVEAFELSVQ